MNVDKLTNDCIQWIREWFNENGKGCNAIIGISGGKDSSVTAALCVAALGRGRVIGIMMPNGNQKDIEYSFKLVEHLGITYYISNIKQAVDSIEYSLKSHEIKETIQTKLNLPPRIRMATLYAYSQSLNGRVANTCNASEEIVGWSTRWGDSVGDFSPLRWLTTRQIRAIGAFLGLPNELVDKTPIDGLTINEDGSYRTDEDNLGVSYDDIDTFIETEDKNSIPKESFDRIMYLSNKNEFKLRDIPSFMPQELENRTIKIF